MSVSHHGTTPASSKKPPVGPSSGFDTEELCTEGQVVVLPAGHPLTTRPHLTTAEVGALPDLPLPRWPRRDGTRGDLYVRLNLTVPKQPSDEEKELYRKLRELQK